MAYAILRVEKLKTAGLINGVGQHNLRKGKTLNANPKVANRVLIGPTPSTTPVVDNDSEGVANSPPQELPTHFWEAVQARIAEVNARIRKNGVLACEVFLGASPEFFRPRGGPAGTWDAGRLEAWETASLAWLKKEWGDKNIVSAVVHLDETTPHLQAVVVPIDPESGRMNAARWLNGRKALSEMQDRYAVAVEGVGLQRGVRGSVAEHTDIRTWYGQLQEPVPQVPAPEVQAPGMLTAVREKSRQEFAQQETARLQADQQPAIATLETQARERRIAVTKRREAEATNQRLANELKESRAREAALLQANATLVAERDRLRQHVDAYRLITLSTAATWYAPEELTEAGVRIGKDGKNRERIFDVAGNAVGRNPIDLAMRVHGCATAGEAVAWIQFRQGEVAKTQALLSSSSFMDLAAESSSACAQAEQPEHGLWKQRCERAQQQVVQREPTTWEGVQQIFNRVQLAIERTWQSGKAAYVLVDSMFKMKRADFNPHREESGPRAARPDPQPGLGVGQSHPVLTGPGLKPAAGSDPIKRSFSELLRDLERQHEARLRKQEDEARLRATMHRGPRR